jgi:AraC-like DNA-binding protein
VTARHSIIGIAENLKWIEGKGFSRESILKGTDIDEGRLSDPNATVNVKEELAFYQNIIAVSNDPLIMFKAGLNLQISSYGMWGLALLSSPTVGKAIDFGIQYIEFSYTYNRVDFFQEAGKAGLRITKKTLLGGMQQSMTEKDLAAIFIIFKALLEVKAPFQEVRVSWSKTLESKQYQDILLCPVSFNCKHIEILFDPEYLTRELRQNNTLTVQLCKEQLEQRLPIFKKEDTTTQQVNNYLTQTPLYKVNIEDCAAQLKISSRHLRRKLIQEGHSFKAIQDQFRQVMAEKYLRQTDMTLEEIAERLGYSDAANFSNAFKRWTKISPRAFAKAQSAHS